MRFVEEIKWISAREIAVSGSVNPSTVEYAIVDTDSGKVLYTVEHEVRSMRHPLYARPLINRNPAQTNQHFAAGHEAWVWSMGAER